MTMTSTRPPGWRAALRGLAFLSALAVVLGTASAAGANPPSQFPRMAVDETFLAPNHSQACGFDVFIHLEGTVRATLFYDRSGTLIRELDTQPALKLTFFAPSTGKSFTFPQPAALHVTYTDGAAVGSAAVATLTGFLGDSGAADAGRLVLGAVVVGVSPDGIPFIDLVSEISFSGHGSDDPAAEHCAVLSGP